MKGILSHFRACHADIYCFFSTYDQPSNRRRNATPQYIEALESQLKRAKALLQVVFPAVDLTDPSIDAHLQNGLLSQLPTVAPRSNVIASGLPVAQHHGPGYAEDSGDSHLEAMVKATGQLDLDEEGHWDYQGHSSGLSFMRGLREFDDKFQIPSDQSPSIRARTMSQDLPSPSAASLTGSSTNLSGGIRLPDKEEARELCDRAIIEYSGMLRVVHLPTFDRQFDRIYELSPEDYGSTEHNFLPLLYAVMALGKLFSDHNSEVASVGYDALTDEGWVVFFFLPFSNLMAFILITDSRQAEIFQSLTSTFGHHRLPGLGFASGHHIHDSILAVISQA